MRQPAEASRRHCPTSFSLSNPFEQPWAWSWMAESWERLAAKVTQTVSLRRFRPISSQTSSLRYKFGEEKTLTAKTPASSQCPRVFHNVGS